MLPDCSLFISVDLLQDGMWRGRVVWLTDAGRTEFQGSRFYTREYAIEETVQWVRRKLAQHLAAFQVIDFNTESAQ